MANVARFVENFENVALKECDITGEIPSWLKGTLVRNGPGMFNVGDSHYNHLFDGLAYICRFHFEDGKMFYSAKYLESECYKDCMKANRIVNSGFGTFRYPDPCKNIFQRFFSFFTSSEERSDNCLVSFTQIGDGVYALTETPKMVRIDLDTLENVGSANLSKYLTLHTYTAHCNGDEEGNVFNVGLSFGKNCNYVFGKTLNPLNQQNAESSHSAEFTELVGTMVSTDPKAPAYFHSFGMSQNYFVLIESPVRIKLTKVMFTKITGSSYRDCMFWDDSLGTNVLVMNRHTGKPLDIKIKSKPFFTFHHANSYEKDGFLIVDYCAMRNPGTFELLTVQAWKDGPAQFFDNEDTRPYLHRMIIPLSVPESAKPGDDLLKSCSFSRGCQAILNEDGSVTVEDARICDITFEFPRYNFEQFNMKEYKYVYGSDALSFSEDKFIGIIKADVTEAGQHITWRKEKESQMCAEPVFVPSPNSVEEDDGVLLVPVMTTEDGDNPYLVVLNAKDLSQLARFSISESRLPFGFHGMYYGPRVAAH